MNSLNSSEEESNASSAEENAPVPFYVWKSRYYDPNAEYARESEPSNRFINRGLVANVKLKSKTTWVPPVNFNQKIRSRKGKEYQKPNSGETQQLATLTQRANDLLSTQDFKTFGPSQAQQSATEEEMISASNREGTSNSCKEEDKLLTPMDPFADWGNRLQYGCSFFAVDNGDMVWDFLEPGHFGIMRLKKSESGLIEAFAEAEMNNKSWTEQAVVVINQQQHLRVLLGVTHEEWCAFLETLGDGPWNLAHQALGKQRPVDSRSVPDKLWYFLCKRRHHLPMLAVQMKRAGIKKLPMKILPKFIVSNIRTYNGEHVT